MAAAVLWQGPGRAKGWELPNATALAPAAIPSPEDSYHPTAGDSVVVFAAHPADEVLGAGGLIRAVVLAGARVHVVIFTNGDGDLRGVDALGPAEFGWRPMSMSVGVGAQRR